MKSIYQQDGDRHRSYKELQIEFDSYSTLRIRGLA